MMKLTTAGESHGKALVAILEGIPAHLQLNIDEINADLARRQSGYGRGSRQEIESDKIEFLSGVRDGKTLGSPITVCIYNRDYENWSACMSDGACDEKAVEEKRLTKVRPGHADLAGMQKFAQSDARNVLERASARETAIRVAAGGIYKQYLSVLGVEICGYVRSICGVADEKEYSFDEIVSGKNPETGMLNGEKSLQAKEKIDQLTAMGDTAGGVVEIRVRGLKSGFGSMMTYAEKLDARLAQGLMSIQAVKGVEVGAGFGLALRSGKEAQDEIFPCENRVCRQTNRAGGIEGGMSNGEEIFLRAAMKPIPTLRKGLNTVDMETGNVAVAAAERSDVCAIVALEVIAEAVVAQVLAFAVSERLGGDTIQQVEKRYEEI